MNEDGRTRILRLITRLNVGGPTRHVALLMAGIDRDRYVQVLLSGVAASHEGEGRLEVPGEVRRVAALGREIRPVRDVVAQRSIRREIAGFLPHVVHTHQGKAGVLGRLEAARSGVGVIVHTYHGHTFRGYFGPFKGRAVRWMERRAARVSHALVCQSASQERDVRQGLGRAAEGKTCIVPPAIPIPTCAPLDRAAARATLGLSDDQLVLLFPARLVPIKRPDRAVAWLAALRRQRDAVLLIAGEGPLDRAVRDQARAIGVVDAVQFLGWRDDLAELHAAADVVVLTSALEGTPLALLEAMAAGALVAGTAVGGVADIVREDGLLLDPDASEDVWAADLLALVDDASRRAGMVEAARVRVRTEHAPARLVDDICALYDRLRR
ncbi:MAG: hypothetical protein CMJ83_10220 [Planctomycetes bacterium]|nr:hypothetical protein [Planctomycetota bacterium]